MPVAFYPYELSKHTYSMLSKAHIIWAKLIVAVSKDKAFINKVFENTAKADDFVSKILSLYNKHIDSENIGVACLRVDYMGDEKPELVEFNLMSIGLNGMSDRVQNLTSIVKKHRVSQ